MRRTHLADLIASGPGASFGRTVPAAWCFAALLLLGCGRIGYGTHPGEFDAGATAGADGSDAGGAGVGGSGGTGQDPSDPDAGRDGTGATGGSEAGSGGAGDAGVPEAGTSGHDAGQAGSGGAGGLDAGPDEDAAIPLPGVAFEVGGFIKPATSTPGVQVISHGLGVVPKVLILWSSGGTGPELRRNYTFGIGVTDGPGSSLAAAAAARDAQSPTDAGRRLAAKAISLLDSADLSTEADLAAWNEASFSIEWTSANELPYRIHYLLIGGSDVAAKLVPWTLPTTTGPFALDTVGFRADAVLHFNVGSGFVSPPPASFGHAHFGMSAMTADGGQWSTQIQSQAGIAPSLAARTQRTDYSLLTSSLGTHTLTKAASFVSMDSDGFTMDFTTANSSETRVFSLALTGVMAHAGSFQKTVAPAPSTQSVAGVGFEPELIVLTSTHKTSGAAPIDDVRMGIGASDGTSQRASMCGDTHGVDPSSAFAMDVLDRVFLVVDNALGEVDASASLSGFDDDGFSLGWDINDASATEIFYLALGRGP